MNQQLSNIELLIQQSALTAEEKQKFLKEILNADKQWNILEFKLNRTEKVKKTTSVLLEETIEELEKKRKDVEAQNKELEIQNALERVRAVAMGMKEPADMLEVCKTISHQLQSLNIKEIRNVQTAIFYESNSTYMNYEYYAKHDKTFITETTYSNNEIHRAFANQMLKGNGEFFITHIKGDEVKDWVAYQKTTNVFIDDYLNNASSLNYYWYSLGPVALGISTYEPLREEDINLFKRFLKVFELSYTRYLDIEQAIAQAREAQIQLALERVRARAMAMQTSEELNALIGIVFTELTKLDLVLTRCVILIYDAETKGAQWWMANSEAPSAPMNFFVKYANLSFFNTYLKGWEERDLKWQYILEGENKIVTDNFLFNETELKTLPAFVIEGMKAPHKVYLNASFNNFGNLTLATLEPLSEKHFDILLRFAKVFDLTYTRFNDLQKAEAQARESQIQLAMERVRARTMAMQKSDELADAASLLFKQLDDLGIKSWSSGFNIWKDDGRSATINMCNPDGSIATPYHLPHTENIFFIRIYEARQRGDDLLVMETGGKELEETYNYMFSLPEVKKVLGGMEDTGFQIPKFQVNHCAFFSQGYLMFITYKPVPEMWDIFKRFGKVFEQTYSRFLDLQKAEEQAREAQIEAALEKVRSRSLAVYKSDEFNEVIKVVFERLQELKIPMTSVSINVIIEGSKDTEAYICGSGEDGFTLSHIRLIYFDHPIANDRYNAYEKGLEFFTKTYTEKEKNSFYEYEFEVSDLKYIPADIKKMVMESQRYTCSVAFTKNSMIVVNDFEGKSLSSKEIDIVKRFARVFEQAYIRFLDLQKAEAQAREARIEAALEKVRSRSLAMHKSDELKDVVAVVFEKLQELNFAMNDGAAIIITFIKDSKDHIQWIADTVGSFASSFKVPYSKHSLSADIFNAKESGVDFFSKLYPFEEKNTYFKYLFENVDDYKVLPDEVKELLLQSKDYGMSIAFEKNSAIFIPTNTGKLVSENEKEILKRFAKVFEQSYIRFLDLQKAESQSRESQIQLALERARAQSMMMQHSTELDDTLRVFHEQVLQLNIPSAFSFLWLPNEEKDRHIFWAAWAENNSTVFKSKAINYPLDRNEPATAQCLIDWKSNEPVVAYHVPPTSVKDYFAAWSELIAGVEELKPENFSDGLYYVEAFMKYGCFGVMVKNVLPEDEKKILSRFAIEFERAYTRFLDLQKAEAQTRESQIQLALERVRAKTMAMHSSEDVTSATETMFDELKKLAINNIRGGITNIHPEKTMDVFGITNMIDGKTMKGFTLFDMNEHPIWQRLFESWNNKDEVFIDYLAGQEKEDYIRLVNSRQNYLPQSIVEFPDTHFQSYRFDQGTIWTYSLQPHSESDREIMKRFASGFALTFRRYQDLKKAEAQAREAQIEASLERVRSRTMGMQKSDELSDAVYVLFQQFKELGEQPDQATIGVINEDEKVIEYWVTMYGNPINKVFKFSLEEPNVTGKIYKAWKENKKSLMIDLSGDALTEFMTYRAGKGGAAINPDEKRRIINVAFFSKGLLNVQSNEERSEESIKLLERFALVFEQTYTRFLDLKNAEAQTREAQIEAALERVRSRTMGMQKSDELREIIQVVYEQFVHLNINVEHTGFIMDYKARDDMHIWLADQHEVPTEVTIPYFDSPHWNSFIEAKATGKDFFANHLSFEEKNKFYKDLFKLIPGVPEETLKYYLSCPGLAGSTVLLDNVGLYIENFSGIPYSDEENKTLMRFGKVFQQTYTRFLDLQKAEAQARQSQVETSLERVRSKTMAMHNSTEVGETVATMFDELLKLGIETLRCGIGIMQQDNKMEVWTARSETSGKVDLVIGRLDMTMHPLLNGAYNNWKNKKDFFSYELKGEDLIRYYTAINNYPDYPVKYEISSLPSTIIHNDFYFAEGSLFVFSAEKLKPGSIKIFKRFASVFGQTYRRYLDLQKAEAQAREAKIEAALERVRATTMAMHKSEDLAKTAVVLFAQLNALGNTSDRISLGIIHEPEGVADMWLIDQSGNEIDSRFILNLNEKTTVQKLVSGWKAGLKSITVDLTGEELKTWLNYVRKIGLIVKDKHFKNRRVHNVAFFSHGWLNISSLEPLSPDMINILERFAAVYSLTYRRFLDLQKAEASAKEAVKQTSLDRIRADIASMRTVNDLDRITPLIWNELTILDIPFVRCGVFIMDDKAQQIHTFLSTPDGKAIAAFNLAYDTPGNFSQVINQWRKKEAYIDHWNKDEFESLAETLVVQNAVETKAQYLNTLPQKGVHLHFLPFLQGMLYVGNINRLNNDEIRLLQSVANTFSTAYARYEDFNKLEAAKKQVEETLSELKQTQQQLVQSEKMASLGELTAGIAHEIQNPLNFVNNFSEVSKELIDEMRIALENGDKEEAEQIANDIVQNLEKINHHGKRADAIVKGMLQHSRKSSGQKEPTDINSLCDEYLRLSFHGLRAKDKSFNADFKTDFDETIEKINIVPQDIGRVLLNLINNAFYAVNEKLTAHRSPLTDHYKPLVSVQTKKLNDKIEIKVEDNGNGIPQNIIDKIFQPFFTTKPTGQGTGLGLSLSYDIIKAHGGEIKVETKEREGSRFIIKLNNG